MLVIGVDPDSSKHGIAIYDGGTLKSLHNWSLMDVYCYITGLARADVIFSIEDVCANNFIYTRNSQANRALAAKVGLSIGRCQQSQAELMRLLEHFGIEYKLHKPQKGNFAKNKDRFHALTGWSARSNEDQRSAAYFGLLEAK